MLQTRAAFMGKRDLGKSFFVDFEHLFARFGLKQTSQFVSYLIS